MKYSGFVPLIAGLLGLRALIAVIGIPMNLNLVWVTWRTRSLHGVCNYLLALNAFCQAIYEISMLESFAVVADGGNLITMKTCFCIIVIPAFAKYFTLCLMVFIGLDRLKCTLLPRWPAMHLEKYYVAFGVFLCACWSTFVIILSYFSVNTRFDALVMCSASEISWDLAGQIAFRSALILNFTSVGIYILLWIVLQCSQKTKSLRATRKIFKSILVIMLIEFIGWGSNSVYMLLNQSDLLGIHQLGQLQQWCVSTCIGYLLYLSTATNAPVLFWCSKDYRRAFQYQFKTIESALGGRSRVVAPSKLFSTVSSTTKV
ncbi:Protein SRSX-24 [Aphelenchoides avenae]|nr:Protein SRSX-24 [Aphelenchus avenae]